MRLYTHAFFSNGEATEIETQGVTEASVQKERINIDINRIYNYAQSLDMEVITITFILKPGL